jgi:hypothetical protein
MPFCRTPLHHFHIYALQWTLLWLSSYSALPQSVSGVGGSLWGPIQNSYLTFKLIKQGTRFLIQTTELACRMRVCVGACAGGCGLSLTLGSHRGVYMKPSHSMRWSSRWEEMKNGLQPGRVPSCLRCHKYYGGFDILEFILLTFLQMCSFSEVYLTHVTFNNSSLKSSTHGYV